MRVAWGLLRRGIVRWVCAHGMGRAALQVFAGMLRDHMFHAHAVAAGKRGFAAKAAVHASAGNMSRPQDLPLGHWRKAESTLSALMAKGVVLLRPLELHLYLGLADRVHAALGVHLRHVLGDVLVVLRGVACDL